MKIQSPLLLLARIFEPLYALAIGFWFIGLKLLDRPMPFDPLGLAQLFYGAGANGQAGGIVLQVLVWALPVLALWIFASAFLSETWPRFCKANRPFLILVNLLASGLVLALHVVHALRFALGLDYFLAYPVETWVMLGLSLVWNAVSAVALVRSFSARDASWQEYRNFRRENAEERPGLFTRLTHWGIQRRLVVSFLVVIFAIIAVLGFVLLRDFSRTILDAVRQNGLNLTEQTAGFINTSIVDPIAIEDFMRLQAKKNSEASFPFESLSYWKNEPREGKQLIQYSTAPELIGTERKLEAEDITGTVFRDLDADHLEFLAPVTLSGKSLGHVQAVFERLIILKPYYQTEFRVYMIAGIFLYLSIFLTYLFGRNIVIPILFLRMSVKTIGTILAEMVHGNRKISSTDLTYQDRVRTRDEIKSLSTEIGNMATVIRGVIPYISASTLKNAERSAPSTEKRDLCFLFTDIRGFTTLCEGHEPAEVVEMLNHYLELQSSIILANKGDIDKFVGDEIMAMFEGPDKELNACRASIGIRLAMAREKEIAEAEKRHVVAIGIGINAGPVIFGSVGAQDRMDFTSIGDTVNLAARLEGANKIYGTKTLITEHVWEKVKDEFLCREIDLMTVKGKVQPVRIYEVLRDRENASKKLVTMAAEFARGLAAYRNQEWAAAEEVFISLVKEYEDETSENFLKRVNMFRKNPPAKNWNGVFNLTVK